MMQTFGLQRLQLHPGLFYKLTRAQQHRVPLWLRLRCMLSVYQSSIMFDVTLIAILFAALSHQNMWSIVMVILVGTHMCGACLTPSAAVMRMFVCVQSRC
jgi:hypothetical protein